MVNSQRKKFFVDSKVQGALVLRCVMYWFACVATMCLLWLAWKIIVLPQQSSFFAYLKFDQLSAQFAPAVITSVLLLPIVIFDCVRLTNRFAGPMYRLRRNLRQAAQGIPVPPLKFRNDDFWQSIAVEFNALTKRMEEQDKALAAYQASDRDELVNAN